MVRVRVSGMVRVSGTVRVSGMVRLREIRWVMYYVYESLDRDNWVCASVFSNKNLLGNINYA